MNELNFECQTYVEADNIDDVLIRQMVGPEPSSTILQLKYDGIWARVVVHENVVSIFSKTGRLVHYFPIDPTLQGLTNEPTVLIGEFMFGSQWSQHPSRKGHLYIFDCVVKDGVHYSGYSYQDRYRKALAAVKALQQYNFHIVPCYGITSIGAVWMEIETRNSHEGIVVRRWDSPYNTKLIKVKRSVEDDFVIIGFVGGEGKYTGLLGALLLSQYNASGCLEEVQAVGGGFTDEQRREIWFRQNDYLGKVVLVQGKSRFDSGALRHPTFIRVRDDKLPSQCILKKSSA